MANNNQLPPAYASQFGDQPSYPNLNSNNNNVNQPRSTFVSTPTPTAPPLPSNTDFSSSTKLPNDAPYSSGDHYPRTVGQEISSFATVLGTKIKEGWNALVNDEPMPDRIPTRKIK